MDKLREGWYNGYGRSFHGSITDYARTIHLGSGYIGSWSKNNLCLNCKAKGIESCRHFEINTARQLCGPFAAMADENVRTVMVLKAAQTAGSLFWDMTVHNLLVHSHFMRIKVLLDSDEKARIYCKDRLMETLRSNPDIAPLLPTGADRFGVTDTELRLLNGKNLFVGGLNERNTSSLPSDVMIFDEGWLHQSDGLIKKGVARTKQVSNRKLILVGQAGLVKQDQDEIWNGLNVRVPVTWECPCCGGRQQFELQKRRPDDFKPLPQKLTDNPMEPPKPGTWVGFKIQKHISELKTPEEIKAACKETTIECYWCGFQIEDTPEMRRFLNDSFEQEYRLKNESGLFYTPKNFEVGFWNPDPASMFVPFAETMEEFVKAQKAKEMGNIIPIRDFYLSRWAQPWDETADQKMRNLEIVTGTYETDPSKVMPNFHSRNMGTDSQKKLEADAKEDVVGSFWFVIRECDKEGNSRQRLRGFAENWEQLIACQKYMKVPNPRHCIDASKWGLQIEMKAAMSFEMILPVNPHPLTKRRDPYPGAWRLFYGDDRAQFMVDGKPSAVSPGTPSRLYRVERDGRKHLFYIFKYRWSNYAFETQLEALLGRTAGMPRFESLTIADLRAVQEESEKSGTPNGKLVAECMKATIAKETGVLTYEQQMSARYETTVRGKQKFENVLIGKTPRPSHYRDAELQCLARMAQDGLLGHAMPQKPLELVAEEK